MKKHKSCKSAMSRRESVAVLLWLPVHAVLLPMLGSALFARGVLTAAQANLLCYATGFVYMLTVAWKFLRREFDVLCDDPLGLILELLSSYLLAMASTVIVGILLGALLLRVNPNNAAIEKLAGTDKGTVIAISVFIAPLVEELMFRGGIFLALSRRSRAAAYILSAVAFSLYHVWAYAVEEPVYWLFALQYIPVSLLLCRCYERTGSIWSTIILHMLINGVSLRVLSLFCAVPR